MILIITALSIFTFFYLVSGITAGLFFLFTLPLWVLFSIYYSYIITRLTQYSYEENCIRTISPIRKRDIPYKSIGCILISNAIHPIHMGGVFYLRAPLGQTKIIDGKKQFTQYPWITLLKTENIPRIPEKPTSYDVEQDARSNLLYGFVYNRESFNELLEHYQGAIYIPLTVYRRFGEEFERAFQKNKIPDEHIKIF